MRPVAVLRPEPGNAATAARAEALGFAVLRLPLFAVRPLSWTPPDPARYDALVLTSANAARHAGADLARFAALPVYAVGLATAAAARAAGLEVLRAGTADAAALLVDARAAGVRRALHLGGRETLIGGQAGVADSIAVYAAEETAPTAGDLARLAGSVALLHSPRAAARLASLAPDRATIRVAALSAAVAQAAGAGWDRIGIAARPDDAALLHTARALAD